MCPCALAQVTGQLPFPLSYIIPWNQRKEVVRRYAGIDPAEVCVGGGGRGSETLEHETLGHEPLLIPTSPLTADVL